MDNLKLQFPNPAPWEKLGVVLKPSSTTTWMSTFAGPSFARVVNDGPEVDIYVTGRDDKNRSQIGRVRISLESPKKILSITAEPLFSWGDPGAFDENGVSYPFLIDHAGKTFMLYVGWMPTVITPFQNHLGLASQNKDGTFTRVSRAPILERNNEDYLCMGSSCVLRDGDIFRLYYTAFTKWGVGAHGSGEAKHVYVIKYAESKDLIHWERQNHICIDQAYDWEFSICRPSVIKHQGKYHMWFSSRGEHYKIGYAHSLNGKNWTRRDDLAGIAPSAEGFDSLAQAYPHVFECRGSLYMIYNGNHYGKEGLGLARLKI